MLGDRVPQAKSPLVTCQPCFGCGALSSTFCAQPSVHCVADAPPRFQNSGVAYIAWVGCPPLPASPSSVRGSWVMLNADSGAAQIRSPGAQISLVRSLSMPNPPGRGPLIVKPNADSVGTSCSVISAPCPAGLGPMSWPTV